ncbi:hypothetical protein SCUCBS95973_000268 [Sporothrix curviconia]|uniref:Uncharacterized protein n=1 Tax=Sporothrix curviconia TaxID=1260050 RepID=A0ABP0ANT0_9PEZI
MRPAVRLACRSRTHEFTGALECLATDLDSHITLTARDWAHTGVYIAIVNSCAYLNYGGDGNVLITVLRDAMYRSATESDNMAKAEPQPASQDTAMADTGNTWVVPAPRRGVRKASDAPAVADPEILKVIEPVQELVSQTDRTVFARVGDPNCQGYIHVRLVWMLCMARLPEGMVYVEQAFPWQELVVTLNNMVITCEAIDRIEQDVFMHPQVDKKAEEEQKIREI